MAGALWRRRRLRRPRRRRRRRKRDGALQGDRRRAASRRRSHPETGRLIALIDPDGERSFLTDRGANDALEARDIPDALIEGAAHIHLSGYSFFAPSPRAAVPRRHAARGRQAGQRRSGLGRVPARGRADNFLAWTRGAAILFPNAEEAAVLAGSTTREPNARGLRRAIRWSSSSAARPAAKPRRGERRWRVDGVETIEAVDTTGAGDAFVAAFLAARTVRRGHRAGARARRSRRRRRSASVGGRPTGGERSSRLMDTIASFDILAAIAHYTYLRPSTVSDQRTRRVSSVATTG